MSHSKMQATSTKVFSERKQRFYDFLKANPVGVLSTVTPDGSPYGVVIYFDTNESFVLSFITRAQTRKHDNLRRNNHIMLTVFEPKTQAVVQVTGVAEEIEDNYAVNGVAEAVLIASRKISKAGFPPVAKLEAGPFVGYRILPTQVRMAIYSSADIGDKRNIFESLESFDLDE
jgi:nitroimidazol reductase NimA-like FMN-containing flavoprotein (pyridoxamine 5'-phosphate oxidase superfamily)